MDFYGVEHVSREALAAALRVAPGDTLPATLEGESVVTRRLAAVPGISAARPGYAFMALTQARDTALLGELRRRALGPLVEMARWQSQGHALAPYFVVARMVGVSDSAAFELFQRGEREKVIRHVLH